MACTSSCCEFLNNVFLGEPARALEICASMDPALCCMRLHRIGNMMESYGGTPCRSAPAQDEELSSLPSQDSGESAGGHTLLDSVRSAY